MDSIPLLTEIMLRTIRLGCVAQRIPLEQLGRNGLCHRKDRENCRRYLHLHHQTGKNSLALQLLLTHATQLQELEKNWAEPLEELEKGEKGAQRLEEVLGTCLSPSPLQALRGQK
jgi:hypothetical protein